MILQYLRFTSCLNGTSQGSQVWHPLMLMNGTSPSFLLEASRRWYHITGIKSLMWQNHCHLSPCLMSCSTSEGYRVRNSAVGYPVGVSMGWCGGHNVCCWCSDCHGL